MKTVLIVAATAWATAAAIVALWAILRDAEKLNSDANNPVPAERRAGTGADLPRTGAKLPAKFAFKESEANLDFCRSQYDGDLTLHVNGPSRRSLLLRFVRDGADVIVLQAHEGSVFRSNGNRLFFARFGARMDGCSVDCFDMQSGKTVWQTELKALGAVPHSAYRNQVTIDLSADHVTITGKESCGDYIEVLDRQTGRVLAHRIYREGYPVMPWQKEIPTIIVPVPTPAQR